MVTGASGATVDNGTQVAWDTSCKTRTAQAARPIPANSSLKYFRAAPAFFEEDTDWWNSSSPDGMYSNWDECTDRHAKKGHVLLINGDVELFAGSHGPVKNSQSDIGDFVGNDVWARGGNSWYQMAPTWPGTPRPFAWIDRPRGP
jgi:hypothetical protein